MKTQTLLSVLTFAFFSIIAGGSIDNDGNVEPWFWLILTISLLIVVIALIVDSNRRKERQEKVKSKFAKLEDFTPVKTITGIDGFYIFSVDQERKKIVYVLEDKTRYINFNDILSVSLIEDSETIISRSLGRTVGGAVVGGLLAGGAGTIVGGLSGKQNAKNSISSVVVRITTKDVKDSHIDINCLGNNSGSIGSDTPVYKQVKENAREIVDIIRIIIDNIEKEDKKSSLTTNSSRFIADELMKLAELRSNGIISEEEFNERKKFLLNGN